ncbi:MAG: hypothetical protein JWN53_691 [Gemmatimonadetes bacterium]|jgi:hypothetical protein|nr:hypothetical protein [Gemmatimonadota bacterium]
MPSMRRLFYVGVAGAILTEVVNVYFVMPMPGSQRLPSVGVAYLLYRWRWVLRGLFVALMAAGAWPAWRTAGRRRWAMPGSLAVVALVVYVVNFRMAADHMFRQPHGLNMQPVERNRVALDRLVVGVHLNGESRAYPLQYIGYHHHLTDTVGGQRVLVSYCTVCRTGRVFTPTVAGVGERFRLVGMDRFNAMLEDETTRSWWRQANGEAIAGSLKGTKLPELPRLQVTLKEWIALHPRTLIMQADPAFTGEYSKDYAFERGTSRKALTGTDTLSWGEKSWVVGLTVKGRSKAYDWNRLRRERIIHDEVGGTPIVLVLSVDNASFFAFERPGADARFALRGDSLVGTRGTYAMSGEGTSGSLTPVNASQEFWHSWRTFQPGTERY